MLGAGQRTEGFALKEDEVSGFSNFRGYSTLNSYIVGLVVLSSILAALTNLRDWSFLGWRENFLESKESLN